jgi:hypothetical protein|tara:strand:- start:14886 stop:15116 length:231 start_codon:yes stop_codon:yes gene_type:complete
MSNVIQFPKAKPKVHVLKFKCPAVLKMVKDSDNDITLEIERISETEGHGTAWVPAVTITDAKEKLHKMIQITEWIE